MRDAETGKPRGILLDQLLRLAISERRALERQRAALGCAQSALQEPIGQADIGLHDDLSPVLRRSSRRLLLSRAAARRAIAGMCNRLKSFCNLNLRSKAKS